MDGRYRDRKLQIPTEATLWKNLPAPALPYLWDPAILCSRHRVRIPGPSVVGVMSRHQPPQQPPPAKEPIRHPEGRAQPSRPDGLTTHTISGSYGQIPDQEPNRTPTPQVESSVRCTGLVGVFNGLDFKLSVFSGGRFLVVEKNIAELPGLSHHDATRLLDATFWCNPISARPHSTRRDFVKSSLDQLSEQSSRLAEEKGEGHRRALQTALDRTARTIAERLAFEVRIEKDTTGLRIRHST